MTRMKTRHVDYAEALKQVLENKVTDSVTNQRNLKSDIED